MSTSIDTELARDGQGKLIPAVLDFTVPAAITLAGVSADIVPPIGTIQINMVCTQDFYINHVTAAAATDMLIPANTLFALPAAGVGGAVWDGSAVKFFAFGASGTLTLLYLG